MLIRFFVMFVLAAGLVAVVAQDKIDILQVGSQTYSNITVLRYTATDLYFQHVGGMKNVKLRYLSPELQKRFEYDPKADQTNSAPEPTALTLPGTTPRATGGAGVSSKPVSSEDNLLDPISSGSLLGKPAPKLEGLKWIGSAPSIQGRCAIVFFFSTWSVPSRKYIPELNGLARQHPDRLVVAGVTPEAETAVAALTEPKIEFPCASDSQGKFTGDSGITSVPQVLLIDHKGIVHYLGHPAGLSERKLLSLLGKMAE